MKVEKLLHGNEKILKNKKGSKQIKRRKKLGEVKILLYYIKARGK